MGKNTRCRNSGTAMAADDPYKRYAAQHWLFSAYYLAYLLQQGGIPVRVENEAKDQFSEAVPDESEAQVWIPASRVEEADALLAELRAPRVQPGIGKSPLAWSLKSRRILFVIATYFVVTVIVWAYAAIVGSGGL